MSEHDHSHPQWEIPPAAATPEGDPDTPAEGPTTERPRGRRRRATGRPGPGRKVLVAAAVGLALLLGGGAGGFAVAAAGDDPGRGVVATTDDANDANDANGRPDRGGFDRTRDLDG